MEYTSEIINISKIKEGFFVGDQIAGTTPEVIVQFKITHIINAAGSQIINQFERIRIKYLTLNWSETPSQNLFDSKDEIANRIVGFIDDSFKKGEGLLAHSVRGQDRVCIVVIIYLMKKYNWALIKCLDFLSSKKQDVDIPKYFLMQLSQFETRLGINKNPQNNNKNYTWGDEQISDEDEMLMRNTYINGLNINEITKMVPMKKSSSKKKIRGKVGWADDRTYGRSGCLITENPQRDLLAQRNIMPVTSHMRLRPSRSCMKNRSFSTGVVEVNHSKVGNVNFSQNNNVNNIRVNNIGKSVDVNIERGRENNTNVMNNNNNNTNTIDKFTFGLDSNLLNQINNYVAMKNQTASVGTTMSVNINPVSHSQIQNQNEKKTQKQYITTPVFKLQKKDQSNSNNNYNRNVNNNNRMNNFFKENNKQVNIKPQRAESYTKTQQKNPINLEGFINVPTSNGVNYRNYSLNKETNSKNNNIILANNYEQIITNNVNNIYIQNAEYNANKYPRSNNRMVNSTSDKQINNNNERISVNINTKKNNSQQVNNYIRKDNTNNNYNNFKQNNNQNQFLGYNNNNNYPKNEFLNNYQPKIQRDQPRNNAPINNYQPGYINFQNNKPLNNFDPSLIKKPQSPNLFNRPSSTKNPVKIQKEYLSKKPSTPDQFTMHHFNNINFTTKGAKVITPSASSNNYSLNSYGNIYSGINSTKNTSHKAGALARPSTAPQKEKKQSKGYSSKPNYLSNMKRVPSPMLHSNNNNTLYRSQKINPEKFRAPSPMLKSSSFNLGNFKRNNNGY